MTVTSITHKLLKGQADAIAFITIDQWIGGVHLEGHYCPWRWSDAGQQIVRAPLYHQW